MEAVIKIFGRGLVVLLLLLSGYYGFAQNPDKAARTLIQKLDTCYASEGPCDQIFHEAVQKVSLIENDTLAARRFLELASLRESKGGYWDSLFDDLHLRALQRFESYGDDCLTMHAHYRLIRYALFSDQPDTTVSRALKGVEVAEACGDSSEIAHAYSYLGASYTRKGLYKMAIEKLFESERIYEGLGDQRGMAMVNLDLSEAYDILGRSQDAYERNLKAAKLYQDVGEDLRYAIALIDLCESFLDMQMPDSVMKYGPAAYEIVKDRHPLALAYLTQRMGQAKMAKGNYSEALVYLEEARAQAKKLDILILEARLLDLAAQCHMKLGQDEEALARISDALALSEPLGIHEVRETSLKIASELYAKRGNHRKALEMLVEHNVVKDSLTGKAQLLEITRLQEKYEAEQRENEIRIAQQELAVLDEKHKAATNRNYALGTAALLLVVFAVAMVKRHQRKAALQQVQIRLKETENSMLTEKIASKNRELNSAALHLAQKNELLQRVKEKLKTVSKKDDSQHEARQALRRLKIDEQINQNVKEFSNLFVRTNPDFYKKLTHERSDLTKSELRLAALIRMNMDSKQIAALLNVSDAAVKKGRYRLRKKLDLASEEGLDSFVMSV